MPGAGAIHLICFGPGNDKNTAAISFLTFTTPASTVSMDFNINGGGTTAIAIGLLAPYADFGDAPLSYGEAMHVIADMNFAPDNIPLNANVNLNTAGYQSGALLPPGSNYLGSQGPDTEPSTKFSADALGDDNSPLPNALEEDAWPAGSTLSVLDAGRVITHAPLCAGVGTVAGWIDFDRSGTFDSHERAEAVCTAGSALLRWTMPADITPGSVFARLRYAADAGEVINPTGVATTGEVEDHMLTVQAPSLSITKSSNAVAGTWTVNEPAASYALTVTNTGPEPTGRLPAVPAAPVTVLDTLPGGVLPKWTGTHVSNGWSCSFAGADITCVSTQVLAAGGSSTFTLPVSIPETVAAGPVLNHASVGGGFDPHNGGVPPTPGALCTDAAHCASHSVTIDATPGLTLVKIGTLNDLDGNGLIDLGETIRYDFVVTNTGLVTLTDVTIDDLLLSAAAPPVAVSPGPQTLAPGATVTFSALYTPVQKNIDDGAVTNTAKAIGTPPSGPPVPSNDSRVTVPPNLTSGLTIVKTGTLNDELIANGLIELGETVTYTFEVTNTGTATIENVSVSDPMLAAATPPVAIDPTGPTTLAPGDVTVFTATYTPTQAQIDSGSVTNTATAQGNLPGDPEIIESPPDTVTVPPNVTPGLTIVKTGLLDDLNGNGLINLGETIRYSFKVTNTGNVRLRDVIVHDPLVTIIEDAQTLDVGGTYKFTAIYTPTQDDIDAGHVTNIAHATGTPPSGPPIDSPEDSVTVPPDDGPALSIDKIGKLNDRDGDGLIGLGETISYRFLVTNTGKVTLKNVTVVDALVAVLEPPQELAPGGSFTFTASYTPIQDDIDAGHVTNIAHATGQPPSGGRISSPPDTVVVPAGAVPGLSIVKTGSLNDRNGDGLIDHGETIAYSFLVTNTGTVSLFGVTVIDKLLTVNEAPQDLAPGAHFTFTATYLPTQANIDAGSVTNTATATGQPLSGPPVVSPPDTVQVPAGARAGLAIIKTGTLNDLNGDKLVNVDETVDYQFLVTNTGMVTLTDVTINDPLVTVLEVPQKLEPGGSFTFTGRYTAVLADINAGYVENTATATGKPPSDPPIESPPDTVIVPPNMTPGLAVQKTASLTDANANGVPELGEIIEYEFLVTNTGKVTLTDVTPRDAGPRFGGIAGANALSAFDPSPVKLDPGDSQLFTATYAIAQVDIDNAAKAGNQVDNFADATGVGPNGRPVVSPLALAAVPLPVLPPTDITISKQAGRSQIWRGEVIDFTILVANTSLTNAGVIDIVDTIPPGFRFVEGSATVNGAPATPSLSGSEIRFAGLALGPKTQFEIRLNLLALATASPGRQVNRANVLDPSGTPLVPEATVLFEVLTEAMLDCSEIVGKVFDDLDRDGYQDEGEPGLPGVRLATVRGVLITTDVHGRFSIPCAALPNSEIGSNFVLKLDTRTLPTGYGLTTDNPAVARLTAGKMTDVNFGASIGRQIRLDLNAAAFIAGSDELHPELVTALDGVIELLEEDKATLVLAYGDGPAALEAGLVRLDAVERQIRDLWRRAGAPYELVVTRQTTGNQGGQQ